MLRTMQKQNSIVKIIGIYHADGGILGELSYVAGKILSGAHCALCDITHTLAWKKQEWEAFQTSIAQPVELLHLNERSEQIKKFTEGNTPCVISESKNGSLTMLLDAQTLEAAEGSVESFAKALESAISSVVDL